MKKFLKIYYIVINIIAIVYIVGTLILQITNPEYRTIKHVVLLLALTMTIFYINIIYKKIIERLYLREKRTFESQYRQYLLKELELDEGALCTEEKKENTKEKTNTNTKQNFVVELSKRNDKKDIIALMLKNNDEITEYFRNSKNQAKTSFWFSVISCIVGLFSLVVGIYGIVILKNISISVISLVSGSVSELISGTIFWVHNKSALQLNHYYDALHQNEKFLSAVNIADKLSDEKREEMYIEIIRTQINIKEDK